MIRHCGMGPSVDLPLNKKVTLPTLPVGKQSFVTQNGKQMFPVLLDNDYFKVVSTRMRNAESVKLLQDNLNDSNNSSKTEGIKPLLCEEEQLETFEGVKERELREFLAEYPTLEQQKIVSPKRDNKHKKYVFLTKKFSISSHRT